MASGQLQACKCCCGCVRVCHCRECHPTDMQSHPHQCSHLPEGICLPFAVQVLCLW